MASLWMYLFIIIIFTLLMNLILAIIFDVYGHVKEEAGKGSLTLWAQFAKMRQEGEEAKVVLAAQKKQEKEQARAERKSQRNSSRARSAATSGSSAGGKGKGKGKGKKGKVPKVKKEKKPKAAKKLDDDAILRLVTEKQAHAADVVTADTLIEEFGPNSQFKLDVNDDYVLDFMRRLHGYVRDVKMQADLDLGDLLRIIGRVDLNMREMQQEMELYKESGDFPIEDLIRDLMGVDFKKIFAATGNKHLTSIKDLAEMQDGGAGLGKGMGAAFGGEQDRTDSKDIGADPNAGFAAGGFGGYAPQDDGYGGGANQDAQNAITEEEAERMKEITTTITYLGKIVDRLVKHQNERAAATVATDNRVTEEDDEEV